MNRPTSLYEGLNGPYVEEAISILRVATTFTVEQALVLSDAWELDNHPDYLFHCNTVAKALANSGRTLPLGWFEAFFADVLWMSENTKCLHAVADAVVATLVKDLVPAPIVDALLNPWVTCHFLERIDLKVRFLLNEEAISI